MNIDWSKKVVLITGSSMGIGYGCAQVLGRCGAHVILNSREKTSGLAALDKLRSSGCSAEYLQGDVASSADIARMADRIAQTHGKLDLLVNNAGVNLFKGLEGSTMEDFDKVIGVDLRGLFEMSKRMLPLLKLGADASIIHIASVHADLTIPEITAYCAAKGAVVSMTRSMAQELGPMGIRVNTISPGFTHTPMLDAWLASTPDPKATMDRVNGLHPLRKIATSEDIGQTVAFLGSPLASSITGINLVVDCGLTTRLMH
ncbi:MAG: SDR family oxidoreductase [Verrucomicrobia bacterium]|nr:SDR family oxidoreductase [Verrucomicrobiota bacterium]